MTETPIIVPVTFSLMLLFASNSGVAFEMDGDTGPTNLPSVPPVPATSNETEPATSDSNNVAVPTPADSGDSNVKPKELTLVLAPTPTAGGTEEGVTKYRDSADGFRQNQFASPLPIGPGMAPVENGVAGKVPDSFTSEPQSVDIRSFSNDYGQTAGSEQSSSQTATADRVAVFTQACHFPLTGPGRYGQRIVRDALVIYEGMQLAIQSNGEYELRFVAEIPRTAAVVRLQFQVSRDDGTPLATITIPPVTIDPDRNLGRHNPGHSVVVSHRGYSHGLNRAIRQRVLSDANRKNVNNHDLKVSVSRSGVVRFGSVPEKGEYSISPVEDATPKAQP